MKRKLSFVSLPAVETAGACAPVPVGLAGNLHRRLHRRLHRSRRGFTMVELLVVIAIMVLMIAAAGPVASSISEGRSTTASAYAVSNVLEDARTYAMANNTYTWVGIFEEDGTTSRNSGTAGVGRIIMAVCTSIDGTKEALGTPAKLAMVSNLVRSPSLQLVSTGGAAGLNTWPTPAAGYQVSDAAFKSGNRQFTFPLTGTATYTFSKIIQFNPLGEASRPDVAPSPWIALGLREVRGNDGTKGNDKNGVGIYVEGLSGRVRIFRK